VLASLTLASVANAEPVLSFSNQVETDPVVGTVVAGGTNLTTPGNVANPASTLIAVTSINGVTIQPPPNAFLIFDNVRGTGATITSGNMITQTGYQGTIRVNSLANGTGTNILTATFTGANLSFTNSSAGGAAGALSAANVTLTSAQANVIAALGGTVATDGSFSIALQSNTNIVASGGTIGGFTAVPQGGFNVTPIPEPASLVLASTAVFVGFGCVGLRRFKSTRA